MTTTRKILITLGLLALINLSGVGAYGYILYKIFLERSRTDEALLALSTELKREDNLRRLADAVKKTSAERQKIDSYFVDVKGSARFLEELQSFGRGAGVSIHLNNVDVEAKKTLRVDFSANGSFAQLNRLIELMEATPYVIEIKSVNLSKVNITKDSKKEKSPANLWSGSFSIRLLSFVNK